jgi:hypothetical protein
LHDLKWKSERPENNKKSLICPRYSHFLSKSRSSGDLTFDVGKSKDYATSTEGKGGRGREEYPLAHNFSYFFTMVLLAEISPEQLAPNYLQKIVTVKVSVSCSHHFYGYISFSFSSG